MPTLGQAVSGTAASSLQAVASYKMKVGAQKVVASMTTPVATLRVRFLTLLTTAAGLRQQETRIGTVQEILLEAV